MPNNAVAIAKKMFIKPGHSILLVNAPNWYEEEMETLKANELLHTQYKSTASADVVQVFVSLKMDIADYVPQALGRLKEGGLFWVSYPKLTGAMPSDIHRDILHREMLKYGQDGVSLIAINEDWSAMRFKPARKK